MPISPQNLLKYKKKIFVETGTYAGDGIQIALDTGFEQIFSIELHPIRFKDCVKRFEDNSKVKIIQGDSAIVLADIVEQLKEPVTFWLDAHGEAGYEDTVAAELEIIKKSYIKTHTILLDDIHESNKEAHKRLKLPERLYEINSNYKVYFINGDSYNTIMVAECE